ncbi:SWIM zinc finger family protein [Methanosarcina horonobensis]|uniref:SWIM zinc finger family protein n=1 Tax=Methanosarcina horonobensis TaxID=418008 RepID=UPI000AD74E8F|nr:SWIM zinc finger family protein [Methanosarcina horonobensis]
MPEDIDSVFRETGLSLFPETLDDLETDCSCPDWSNPCKHIAAVYYLLGEEFDRDPFLIFKLRGVDMDDFMSILGKGFVPETADQVAEAGVLTERPEDKTGTALEAEISSVSPEPLPFDPETFWGRLPENPEEEKKALPLGLTSLRFQPPFQKGLENFPSGVVKRTCLTCWRKSTKKFHLQG